MHVPATKEFDSGYHIRYI